MECISCDRPCRDEWYTDEDGETLCRNCAPHADGYVLYRDNPEAERAE